MSDYPPNVLNAQCPSRKVLEMLADKWTLLVMAAISRGVIRHNALLREVGGISQKMLTQTLRSLERDGIVTRQIYPVVPPMVEYRLTSLGQSLIGTIASLGRWAEENYPQVEAARKRYDGEDKQDFDM